MDGQRSGGGGVSAIVWFCDDAPATVTLLNRQTFVIGRGASVDVALEFASVSRNHAELRRQGPIHALSDLGSTNGTFLNGVRVQIAPLSPGDVVRLGEVLGVVVRLASNAGDVALSEVARGLWFGPSTGEQVQQLRRAAPSDLSVMLVGETGVGKEHFAKALHALSGRHGAFQALNCAALPAALAEAELFGYRRGAFTGAEQAATGLFRAAHGGTLFLDELGELPLGIQAKLLRVLQDKEVTPLGEVRPVTADVRVVAAGQHSLQDLVAAQRLRPDLAMRLAGLELVIPPLRSRRLEIALLFRHFLERYSGGRPPGVDSRLLECLLLHPWPGNVRELELATRRLLVLYDSEPTLRAEFLPASFEATLARMSNKEAPRTNTASTQPDRHRHDIERLASALRESAGNITRAAKSVGISRQRAHRLLATQDGDSAQKTATAAGNGRDGV